MSKPLKANKVDLTLLKRLVSELESSLSSADEVKELKTDKTAASINDSVVELSKAMGLTSGIMQEATLLMMDIQSVIRSQTAAPVMSKNDLLDKILGPLKGNGTN